MWKISSMSNKKSCRATGQPLCESHSKPGCWPHPNPQRAPQFWKALSPLWKPGICTSGTTSLVGGILSWGTQELLILPRLCDLVKPLASLSCHWGNTGKKEAALEAVRHPPVAGRVEGVWPTVGGAVPGNPCPGPASSADSPPQPHPAGKLGAWASLGTWWEIRVFFFGGAPRRRSSGCFRLWKQRAVWELPRAGGSAVVWPVLSAVFLSAPSCSSFCHCPFLPTRGIAYKGFSRSVTSCGCRSKGLPLILLLNCRLLPWERFWVCSK